MRKNLALNLEKTSYVSVDEGMNLYLETEALLIKSEKDYPELNDLMRRATKEQLNKFVNLNGK